MKLNISFEQFRKQVENDTYDAYRAGPWAALKGVLAKHNVTFVEPVRVGDVVEDREYAEGTVAVDAFTGRAWQLRNGLWRLASVCDDWSRPTAMLANGGAKYHIVYIPEED